MALKKLKSLFNQLYDYARMHDIVSKDYSVFVDISLFSISSDPYQPLEYGGKAAVI